MRKLDLESVKEARGERKAQDNRHKPGKKDNSPYRKGFDDQAMLKLLNGSYGTPKYKQVLHDLLRLGLYKTLYAVGNPIAGRRTVGRDTVVSGVGLVSWARVIAGA